MAKMNVIFKPSKVLTLYEASSNKQTGQASTTKFAPDSHYGECQCKLYLATFLALLSAFTSGHATSLGLVLDPDLILDFPRYKPRQFCFAMALYFSMGQIAGASIAKFLCQNLGPKKALTVASISFLFSWLFMLQHMYIINSILWIRFLNGFSAGLVAVSLLIYLFDISIPKYRGFILSNFTTATLLGTYLPMLFYLKDPYFYTVVVLGFNLLAILVLYLLPESPVWLMNNSNDPRDLYAAEKALQLIRTSSNACATLYEINRLVGEKDQSCLVLMDHSLFFKPLRLSFLLMLLHQSTFLSVFYLLGRPMPHLFAFFGNNNNAKDILAVHFNEAVVLAIIQIGTMLVVAFVLVRFIERRTILVTCGCMIIILNVAQAIVVHHMSGNITKVLSILIYITAVFSTVIESVVWVTVAEMPLHEHRVFTCMCVWVGNWLVTSVVLCIIFQYGKRACLLFVSSFALIAVNAMLYMWLPNTRNRTTSQIMQQFISKS